MSPRANRPAARLIVGVAVLLLVTGCSPTAPSQSRSTSTPSTTAPPGYQPGQYTVSGLVTESGRPVAAANVNAWVSDGSFGYSWQYVHGFKPAVSDDGGHYHLTSLGANARVWLEASKDGYVQQCAATLVLSQGDATRDIALVSRANLTASPPPSAPGSRSIVGTVVEMTSAGPRPVAGAAVDFEPFEDVPAAFTYTDGDGRFALCGLPENEKATLGVGSNGRVAYADIPPGQTDITITLPQ